MSSAHRLRFSTASRMSFRLGLNSLVVALRLFEQKTSLFSSSPTTRTDSRDVGTRNPYQEQKWQPGEELLVVRGSPDEVGERDKELDAFVGISVPGDGRSW